MEQVDWKELSQMLSEEHNNSGAAVLPIQFGLQEEGLVLVPREWGQLDGEFVSSKVLRKFWWDQRRSRATARESGVVWSSYSKTEDVSLFGFGVLVPQAVQERWKSFVTRHAHVEV